MLHRLRTWWCGFKHGHRLNKDNISVACGSRADGMVTFHCARCQKSVETKPLDDCEPDVVEVVRYLLRLEPDEFDVLEREGGPDAD